MSLNPREQLTPDSLSISELLCNNFFEIPKNQRDYRWQKENVEKLWSDLVFTMNHEINNSGDKSIGHFLGSIVVIGTKQSLSSNRWQIIDGQQRMTTLTILACCFRPYVEKFDNAKLKRQLGHTLYNAILSPEVDELPRIFLNSEKKFFEKSLLECETADDRRVFWEKNWNKSNEVQTNIKNTFEFFDIEIKKFCDDAGESWQENLIELIQTFNNSLYILLVRVSNLWMAYRIFETLNERGLDLTQAELIKNVLIEHASETGLADIEEADKGWKAFVSNYESQPAKKLDMPHLIQFSYSYRHDLVKKGDIFDIVSEELRSGGINVFEFLEEIETDSSNWAAFLQGDLVKWSDTQEDSQYAIIDPLWKKHCAPFIFSIMLAFKEDAELLERAMVLCEHYLFRQGLVCNDSVSTLQKVFSDAATMVRDDATIEELSHFFKRFSPDTNFIDNFKIFSVTNMKQGFYVFWKIEVSEQTKNKVLFKPSKQSAAQHLEHIMPKKPDGDWNGIEEIEGFSKSLNRIGNMLILEGHVNQHIKNRSISYKMSNESDKDYASSSIMITKEFRDMFSSWAVKGKWDFEAINLRQLFLAEKYASKVWTLDI